MYSFKAKCTANTQSPNGSHSASFSGEEGGAEAVIPSKDLMFEVGNEYSFSVDGKFKAIAKPAPAPVSVVPAPVVPAPAKKP